MHFGTAVWTSLVANVFAEPSKKTGVAEGVTAFEGEGFVERMHANAAKGYRSNVVCALL